MAITRVHALLLMVVLSVFGVALPGCSCDDDTGSDAGGDTGELPAIDDDDAVDDDNADDDDGADDDAIDDDNADDDEDADDDAVDDDTGDDDTVDDDTGDDDTADDDTGDDDESARVPLLDEMGREIVLRGANYMGMEFGWFNHAPEDFERIASWGFNVVRLPIAWDYLEPDPGVWDDTYLPDVVDPAVQYASDAGLRVIIDMHQWNWCKPLGGNGIPDWICEDFAGGAWPWNYMAATTDFWTHPDYLDDFVEAWSRVAEHFADDDRVFAFDLFNEPVAGWRTLPWTFENPLLRPLYVRFIDAIRAHHQAAYIVIEPSIIDGIGLPFVMDPIDDPRLIFGPHLYPGDTGTGGSRGYDFGIDRIRNLMAKVSGEAIAFGAPLLLGEMGIVSKAPGAGEYTRDASTVLDEAMAHSTWWVFWRDDNQYGLIDANGDDKAIFLDHLDRPYPRATAGRLVAYGFDETTRTFTVEFKNTDDAPQTTIYIPARHFPDGFDVASTDAEAAWSFAFDADTRLVTVDADPLLQTHTITVTPLPASASK
ncbi:cellulase family glycosylhydrolase [bacterium]|nr:cellulase family glycosylhydrolase [bacterium]